MQGSQGGVRLEAEVLRGDLIEVRLALLNV